MRILILLAPLLLVPDCHEPVPVRHYGPTPDRTFVMAFYNLENAFDPADDPTISGDDEFTPHGKMKWTMERLEHKLGTIGRGIRAIDDYRGPDLIGLCEVENRHVVELLAGEYLPSGEYAVVHTDSPDERGIDVALLYRASLFKLVSVIPHRVDLGAGNRPTRDIIEAAFTYGGRAFTVLVCHWPSRLGGEDQSAPRRRAAALVAAGVIDSLYRLNPHADIVMMGDMNDEPTDSSLRVVLQAAGYHEGSPFQERMINTAVPVAEADTIGSYFYRGSWEVIDQILLSRGTLDSSGLTMYEASESVFAPDFLRDDRADSKFRPPYRTYRGTEYLGGASDHFPVMLRLGWKE